MKIVDSFLPTLLLPGSTAFSPYWDEQAVLLVSLRVASHIYVPTAVSPISKIL